MLYLTKIKPYLPQLILLAALYGVTALVFLTLIPDADQANSSGGDQPAADMRYSLLFVVLFFPMILRNLINVVLSPLFPIARKFTRRPKKLLSHNYRPLVSVIVPAWNEEVRIVQTMRSVMNNTYPNKELIVVNDGSTDGTELAVLNFIKSGNHPLNIIYIRQKNRGKAAALNNGLKKTRGRIVITLDADSAMAPDAIRRWVECFRDPRVMSVAGNVKIGNSRRAIGIIQMIEYLWGFYFKKADSIMNSIYIVGGAAAAYRREVFDRLGGFDEQTLTEDIEMSTRIQDAGWQIAYAPDAVVFTEGPSTLEGLVKQRLRWKKGRFETFWKYSHLFFNLKRRNRYLTVFILPLAMFMEALLFFEAILLFLLYSYIFTTGETGLLALSIAVLTAILALLILFNGLLFIF